RRGGGEARIARNDQVSEVARRDGERADERGTVRRQHRVGHVVPLERPWPRVGQLPHAATLSAWASAASSRSSPQNGVPPTASVGTPITPWTNAYCVTSIRACLIPPSCIAPP